MESKSLYPDANIQTSPLPPPTYDSAMGFIPPQQVQPHQQHYQQQSTVQQQIIVPASVIISPPVVGPNPNPVICPHCRSQIITKVEHEPGTKTHLLAIFLCLFGCWCCPCLPYCIDDCKNANHYCPQCGAFIGSYSS